LLITQGRDPSFTKNVQPLRQKTASLLDNKTVSLLDKKTASLLDNKTASLLDKNHQAEKRLVPHPRRKTSCRLGKSDLILDKSDHPICQKARY